MRNVLDDNNGGTTAISIAIIIVSIFLLFSLVNIFQEASMMKPFTGHVVQDINESEIREPEKLYSEKAHGFFYVVLVGIVLLIAILSLALILPMVKSYT